MTARMTSRRLVGREAELASLRVLLTAAAAGEARVAVVSGDAGIGKTRLLEALAAEDRAAGFVTATGGAVRLGAVSVPFAPLVEALRALQDGLGDPRVADVLTMLGDGAPGSGSYPRR